MAAITNVNNPVTSTSGQTKSAAEQADALANVNFDMFLNLMVTQLQNQDPLNPADGTQFTEQLATFSQLEQQVASNKHLEKLANAQSLTSQSLAVNMIGKEVMAQGQQVKLVGGKGEFQYKLEKDAATGTLEVFNGTGQVVKTFELNTKKGLHKVEWDGKDDDNKLLANGEYKVVLNAFDADGKRVTTNTYVYSTVKGVESEGVDKTYLMMKDGKKVLFEDVFSVRDAV